MDASNNPDTPDAESDGHEGLVAILEDALARADLLGFPVAAAYISQALELIRPSINLRI